jgi:hypothetical protein
VGSAEAEAAFAEFDAGGVLGLQDARFNDVTETTVSAALMAAGRGQRRSVGGRNLLGRRGGGWAHNEKFLVSGGSNRAGNDEI